MKHIQQIEVDRWLEGNTQVSRQAFDGIPERDKMLVWESISGRRRLSVLQHEDLMRKLNPTKGSKSQDPTGSVGAELGEETLSPPTEEKRHLNKY